MKFSTTDSKANQNYLSNFYKLNIIVMTIEEWLLVKYLKEKKIPSKFDHGEYAITISSIHNNRTIQINTHHPSKHIAKAPHVQ